MKRSLLPWVTILAVVATAGCADARVRAGTRPEIALLEQKLVAGESSMDDVRGVLGAPYGTGSSMLPVHARPRTMWSYYYEEGNLSDDRRMFLFVFFTDDHLYEGYLWFSSLPGS